MILVHVSHTWPAVLAKEYSADDATLGDWYGIADWRIAEFGDTILGIYQNTVVSAYDVTGPPVRGTDGRVTFADVKSRKWAYLIGAPNPGKPWGVRGMARPVQYLDTALVDGGSVDVEETPTTRRVAVDRFTLAVDSAGTAVLTIPPGRKITIMGSAA